MATTKARREAATLVGAVFLLGILLGGVGNHLWGDRVWGMHRDAPVVVAPGHFTEELSRELQLTPEQQAQIQAIVRDTQARWRNLYAPLDGQREQIREESHDRMREILTPGQKPKFDAFLQRLEEQRKKDAARQAIPTQAR
jgi:Spy/CpxP family protein refolding chaperone